MKHIQNKLTRALATKDWRLVEEAWAIADIINHLSLDEHWDKPKPIVHPYAIACMLKAMRQPESD